MRPDNRKMEIVWLQKQNTGQKSRPHRPKGGPISVEWKMLGYKSRILGFNAAPEALLRPHNIRMENVWL